MNIKHVLTLVATAAVSFAASAAPAAPATADAQDVAAVTVSAGAVHSHYKPTFSELQGVKGAYTLADGRTLHVSGNNYHLYADVDGQKTEIVPVAPNVFASRDDGMRLVFDDSDITTDVTLSVLSR